MRNDVKLFTVQAMPNKEYEVISLVKGNVVQSKNVVRDVMASVKTVFGGEIKSYTEMLNEAREIATGRMIEEAEKLGANAIIAINYSTSSVMPGTTEVLVYGTAIRLR